MVKVCTCSNAAPSPTRPPPASFSNSSMAQSCDAPKATGMLPATHPCAAAYLLPYHLPSTSLQSTGPSECAADMSGMAYGCALLPFCTTSTTQVYVPYTNKHLYSDVPFPLSNIKIHPLLIILLTRPAEQNMMKTHPFFLPKTLRILRNSETEPCRGPWGLSCFVQSQHMVAVLKTRYTRYYTNQTKTPLETPNVTVLAYIPDKCRSDPLPEDQKNSRFGLVFAF